MSDFCLHEGDARDILPTLAAGSVGAVVTDPPYGLIEPRSVVGLNRAYRDGRTADEKAARRGGFMGQKWDGTGIAFNVELWEEVYRVMKPGAYLVASGGTRTYHRMACAIEDAGFLIKDSLMWCHGQGFPKSKNLGDGLGTALKPSFEPIVLAQKPLQGTYAANVAKHGVGALAIDQCRVGLPEDKRAAGTKRYTPSQMAGPEPGDPEGYLQDAPHDGLGRWPTNLVLTHSPLCVPTGTRRVKGTNVPGKGGTTGKRQSGFAMGPDAINHYADADGLEEVAAWSCVESCPIRVLDAQSGTLTSGKAGKDGHQRTGPSGSIYGPGKGLWREEGPAGDLYGDTGGASRFFPTFAFEADDFAPFLYQSKAPASERLRVDGVQHVTQKPLALMKWLVRLVAPPSTFELVCNSCDNTPSGDTKIGGAHDYETVPTVREDLRDEAAGDGLLLGEVPGGEHGNPANTVPDLREDRHEGARQVLLTGMPSRVVTRPASDALPEAVRAVRETVPADVCRESVLLPDVQQSGDCGEAGQGLCADATRLHPPLSPDAFAGDQGGICDGTPGGNGGTPGPRPVVVRSSASHQWQEGRQPSRKSAANGQGRTRPGAEAGQESDHLPLLRRDAENLGACPQCGSRLTRVERRGAPVLDPFAGSGTTGVACILEGRAFIGIEREAAYMAISRRRLETTQPALPGLGAGLRRDA